MRAKSDVDIKRFKSRAKFYLTILLIPVTMAFHLFFKGQWGALSSKRHCLAFDLCSQSYYLPETLEIHTVWWKSYQDHRAYVLMWSCEQNTLLVSTSQTECLKFKPTRTYVNYLTMYIWDNMTENMLDCRSFCYFNYSGSIERTYYYYTHFVCSW